MNEFKKPEYQQPDYMQLLQDCELDYANPPEAPPTVFKISGQSVGTLGNFSLLIGKAKARKTFFLTSVAGALISSMDVLNANGTLPDNKRVVLWFDTEQGNYHAFNTYKRAASQGGSTDFRYFALRRQPTDARLAIIEHAIQSVENIGVVVVDGVRDLIHDINSPDEATMLSDKLLQLTDKHNIHIIAVLHQNKTSDHARGHVGTELINKAESTILVKKDDREDVISYVLPEFCRDKDFEPFAFCINDEGLPEITQAMTAGNSKIDPDDYLPYLHHAALGSVFKNNDTMTATELRNSLARISENMYVKFGITKAKEFIEFYIERDLLKIKQQGNKKIYSINNDMAL